MSLVLRKSECKVPTTANPVAITPAETEKNTAEKECFVIREVQSYTHSKDHKFYYPATHLDHKTIERITGSRAI